MNVQTKAYIERDTNCSCLSFVVKNIGDQY